MQKAFPCFNPGIYEPDDPLWPQNGWDIGPEALGRIFSSRRLKQIGLRIAYEMLRECGVYEAFLVGVRDYENVVTEARFLEWLRPWSERVWEVLNLENPTEDDWESIGFLELPAEDVEELFWIFEAYHNYSSLWWQSFFRFLFSISHFHNEVFDDNSFFHAIHNAAEAYGSMYIKQSQDGRYDRWNFIRLARMLHPGWSQETQENVELYLILIFWDEWRERCMRALSIDRLGQHEISGLR